MQKSCIVCSQNLKEPVECDYCFENFCKEHIKSLKNCPSCNASLNYHKNNGLIKILEEQENERINKMIKSDDNNVYQCNICSFEGIPDHLIFHLAQEHKKQLLEIFGIKKENNNFLNLPISKEKEEEKKEEKEEEKEEEDSLDNNSEPKNDDKLSYNINNEECIIPLRKQNSEKIEDLHLINLSKTERESQKKEIKYINQSYFKQLYYCGKKNELINCKCCSPEHKCINGNCLCVKCMRYNVKKLNLKNKELINKAGRIAKLDREQYHCGIKFNKYIKNEVGKLMPIKNFCSMNFTCDECLILNKYKDIYLAYINDKK